MGTSTRFEHVRQRRALIVHGDLIVRDRLERTLRRAGFEVEATASRDGCFEIGSMSLFDVAVVAAVLPDADGIALLRRLRLEPRMRHIPVVILSDASGPNIVVSAMEAGADDHIREPFDNEELAARIRRIVTRNVDRRMAASERSYVLAGDFSGFPFHELVGFLCQNSRSGVLNVVTREAFGKVWFIAGQVADVVYGNLIGEKAFFSIFTCAGGHFEFVQMETAGTRRTIELSTMGLLLEAARCTDDAPRKIGTPECQVSESTTFSGVRKAVVERHVLSPEAWSAAARAVADDINVAVIRVLTQKNMRADFKAVAGDFRALRVVILASEDDGTGFLAPLAPSMPASLAGSFLGSTALAIAATATVRGSEELTSIDMLHVPLSKVEAFGKLLPSGVDVIVFAPSKGDVHSVPLATRIAIGEFVRRTECAIMVGIGDDSSESVIAALLEHAGWDGSFVWIEADAVSIPDAREMLGKVFSGVADSLAKGV